MGDSLKLRHPKGGHRVDLTLNFNLLAVCTVILFLGAFFLGTF